MPLDDIHQELSVSGDAVVRSDVRTDCDGYTVPTGAGAKPVQDAAGSPAASFSNSNTTDALPVVSIAPATTPVSLIAAWSDGGLRARLTISASDAA